MHDLKFIGIPGMLCGALLAGPALADDLAALCKEANACVYVSQTARADGDGSRANPLRTIQGGLDRAAAIKAAHVLVAKGRYDEAIVIKTPVELLGGFTEHFLPLAQATFKREDLLDADRDVSRYLPPKGEAPGGCQGDKGIDLRCQTVLVAPAGADTAVTISGAPAVSLSSLVIRGADRTAADGGSSYAIRAIGAAKVPAARLDLYQVKIIAGHGAPGRPGASAAPAPNYCVDGGDGGSSGTGENPRCQSHAGGEGKSADARIAAGKGGAAGFTECGESNMELGDGGDASGGGNGNAGLAGHDGKTGAEAVGFLDLASGRWQGKAGGDGSYGMPGSGGGGGGAGGSRYVRWNIAWQLTGRNCGFTAIQGGTGGKGGQGGCGGPGGTGGGAGGSSIGIAAVGQLAIHYDNLSILLGNGGNGGDGGAPQTGYDGESGGTGDAGKYTICTWFGNDYRKQAGKGGTGGSGGTGGVGGRGAGGNGGFAIGVARGEAVQVVSKGFFQTVGGRPGKGGVGGEWKGERADNDGLAGISAPEHKFEQR